MILKYLLDCPQVATMILRGARLWEIAEAFGYSQQTAMVDRDRVRELWRREAYGDIIVQRDRSTAQFREIIVRSWEAYPKETKTPLKLAALREVLQAEKEIVRLQGTKAPEKREVKLEADQRPLSNLSDDELSAALAELDGDEAKG